MQSSIEFVVILSGVISLVVASVAMYAHQASYQKLALESISNVSNSTNVMYGNAIAPQAPPKMYVYASIGSTIYLNNTNQLGVVVSLPVGAHIDSIIAYSDSVRITPHGFYNMTSDGIDTLSFGVVPKSYGPANISVETLSSYGNKTFANTTHVYTFATEKNGSVTRNATEGGGLNALILYGNQSILYNLTEGTDVIGTRTSNHCLYQNFWYQPYPVNVQCGTGNAWDFWIFDNICYSNGDLYRVYCIYPTASAYRYYGIDARGNYAYNITLRLYNSSTSMAGALGGKEKSTNMTYGGKVYGNATVGSVTGQGPTPSAGYVVLSNGSMAGAVNMSAYDEYSQALGNMESTLGYYNDSGVSQDQIDQIWQEIGSYDKAAAIFEGAPRVNVSGCSLSGSGNRSNYTCSPYSNLDYVINALVYGTTKNYSVNYGGSVINIMGRK